METRGARAFGRLPTAGALCTWPEPECDESPGLAGKPLVLLRIDGGGFGDGAWFQQGLDTEPGRADLQVVSSGASQYRTDQPLLQVS
jgi:hypothetical protein